MKFYHKLMLNGILLIVTLLFLNMSTFGQLIIGSKKISKLINHSHFEWVIDSLDHKALIYFEKNSFAHKNKEVLRDRIQYHVENTISFVGIENYDKPIHYFILENRERMKSLIGLETNGSANYKENYVTAIFSSNIKSAYSNHELFHLIAMNEWGYTEGWLNEGMAVYSDNNWFGYSLHELAKYLIDQNDYIPMAEMTKRLRMHDSLITYPLLGSFAKYLDETYGRETIKQIWKTGKKRMKKFTGKNLADLENEWLKMLGSVEYNDINYLK